MLTEATAANLKRKAHWADHVQMHEAVPLPSWIDLDPVDRCNRACVFCPRSDPSIAPNQKNDMSLALAEKIAAELHSWKYEGAVVLCGTGEPLLHPDLAGLLAPFRGLRTEIVTNGDRLTPAVAAKLYDAGLGFLAVSMYDGPHQIDHFRKVLSDVPADKYILRDRWHDVDGDFGLKLTNRAGTVNVGNQPGVNRSHPCWYLQYCMTISWDGRVLLCPQDWNDAVVYGNVFAHSMLDIWTSRAMNKRRMQLLRGRDGLHPCQNCNTSGTMHGENHIKAWQRRAER